LKHIDDDRIRSRIDYLLQTYDILVPCQQINATIVTVALYPRCYVNKNLEFLQYALFQ